MGLVIYSPRLNDLGIPPLAEAFCKQITLRYRVNLFDQLVYGDSVIEANDGDQNVKATSMKQSLLFFELCTASGEGNVKRVQELIEDGADVNRVDYDKRSALHIACSDGHYEVAKLLVKEGASILVKDRWGQTPYDDAIRGGHHTIIDLLNAGLAAQGYRIHAAPFLQALQPPVAVTEAAAHRLRSPHLHLHDPDISAQLRCSLLHQPPLMKTLKRGSEKKGRSNRQFLARQNNLGRITDPHRFMTHWTLLSLTLPGSH